MNTATTTIVRVTRRFRQSAERVFDAFLDPAKAGRFLFTTPSGEMVRVEIDARVGGAYRFVDRRDGEDVPHTGTYLEIDRPHRLVFTLQVDTYSQDIGRVAIDIRPLDDGCELTLTHEIEPEWAEQTTEGWGKILDGLAAVLEG